MPELRIIGEVIYLDGEPVADIRPDIRAALRDELRELVDGYTGDARYCAECGEDLDEAA